MSYKFEAGILQIANVVAASATVFFPAVGQVEGEMCEKKKDGCTNCSFPDANADMTRRPNNLLKRLPSSSSFSTKEEIGQSLVHFKRDTYLSVHLNPCN